MTAYRALVAAWSNYWFVRVPPHLYALIRILLGGIGVVSLIGLADIETFWAMDGLVPYDDNGLGLKDFLRTSPLAPYFPFVLYFATVAAFLGMAVGFQTNLAVCFALILSLLQLSWSYLPLSGAHSVMQGLLFCLIWADCGAVWSIDAWLERRKTPKPQPVPVLTAIAPLLMMRYQVALVYLSSGLWKLYSPNWRDGSAVHYVLNNNVFHRFPGMASSETEWLLTAGTYITLLWEIFFAVGLLFPVTRRLVLIVGVLTHVGMFVAMEVGPFPFVMLTGYLAFLDPRNVPSLIESWRRILNGSRKIQVPHQSQ